MKTVKSISRRNLIKHSVAVPAAGLLGRSVAQPLKLASIGWSWEGQGINAPRFPSVYGAGEGAEYFGLKKVIFMYHHNNELAMEKLRPFEEVVCDITKWKGSASEYSGVQLHYDSKPRTLLEEAEKVALLSLTYPNVKGAYFDGELGRMEHGGITPRHCASVSRALRETNPNFKLKLWAVVFSDELDQKDWTGFRSHLDVINLRIRSARDLPDLDRYVDRCREIFPDQAIVLGCSLWDYPTESPMPLDRLTFQWEQVLKYVASGKIDGYSIFATFLIDSAQQQAQWVRDFIAAN